MGDTVQPRLPSALKVPLSNAQDSYEAWLASENELFGEEGGSPAESMADALGEFVAGALAAGATQDYITGVLRKRFPQAAGHRFFESAIASEPGAHEEEADTAGEYLETSPDRSLLTRYGDAYVVARAVTGWGSAVKAAAIAVVLLGAVGGIVASSQLGASWTIVAGLIAGTVYAVPVWVLGLLLAAQGQMLRASLDTAVNTSPLLTEAEMRRVMSLD